MDETERGQLNGEYENSQPCDTLKINIYKINVHGC